MPRQEGDGDGDAVGDGEFLLCASCPDRKETVTETLLETVREMPSPRSTSSSSSLSEPE